MLKNRCLLYHIRRNTNVSHVFTEKKPKYTISKHILDTILTFSKNTLSLYEKKLLLLRQFTYILKT